MRLKELNAYEGENWDHPPLPPPLPYIKYGFDGLTLVREDGTEKIIGKYGTGEDMAHLPSAGTLEIMILEGYDPLKALAHLERDTNRGIGLWTYPGMWDYYPELTEEELEARITMHELRNAIEIVGENDLAYLAIEASMREYSKITKKDSEKKAYFIHQILGIFVPALNRSFFESDDEYLEEMNGNSRWCIATNTYKNKYRYNFFGLDDDLTFKNAEIVSELAKKKRMIERKNKKEKKIEKARIEIPTKFWDLLVWYGLDQPGDLDKIQTICINLSEKEITLDEAIQQMTQVFAKTGMENFEYDTDEFYGYLNEYFNEIIE